MFRVLVSCLILCLFLASSLALGQVEVKFTRVNTPERSINAIVQDKYGFLWLGTDAGLIRFDGEYYKSFKMIQVDSLEHEHNIVLTLFIDSKQRLWIGTQSDGLFLMNLETETFKHLEGKKGDPKALSSNRVFSISEDLNKNIWIAAGGMNRLDEKTWTIVEKIKPTSKTEVLDTSPSPYSNGISVQDKTGRFWLGTWRDDVGVDTFRLPAKKFYHLKADRTAGAVADNGPQTVRNIFLSKDGDVWFATYRGLYHYSQKTGNFKLFYADLSNKQALNGENISQITEDKEGNLWLGTFGGGLSRFNRKTETFTNYVYNNNNSRSIPNDNVQAVFVDREGIVWVGTTAGLAYLNPNVSRFSVIKPIVPKFETYLFGGRHIVETADGTVWSGLQKGGDDLGASYGGLLGYHPLTGQQTHFLPPPSPTRRPVEVRLEGIQEVSPNKLWFQFLTSQFTEYSNGKFKKVDKFEPNKSHELINFLYSDFYKELYVNDLGNFHVWENNLQSFRTLKNSSGYADFAEMIMWEDAAHDIWYLYKVDSLYRYDRRIKDMVRVPIVANKDFNDLYITGVCAHSEPHLMWISSDLGLQLIDKRNGSVLKSIGKAQGLPYDPVFSLNLDKNGFLWTSGAHGLSRINLRNFKIDNYFLDTDLPVGEIYATHYGRAVYGQGKYTQNLYYKTNEGVMFFDPNKIIDVNFVANIVFSDLKVNNENYKLDSLLTLKQLVELPPDADVITIQYVLLNYSSSESNKYRYQLIGFDKKPVEAGNINYVTYTNLPPGAYIFRVWAQNGRGLSSALSRDITIVKKPYFWQRLGFKVAGILTLIGIASLLVYWRINSLRVSKLDLENKVKERTKTIESKNQEILDSINYARRIQNALLPQREQFSRFVPPFWTLYKPRSIVSGDFYWINEIKMGKNKRRVLIAAADCTGHGVPGAMMSMMGHNLLDEITNGKEKYVPNLILEELNSLVRKTLRQIETSNRDGMTISLLALDMFERPETQTIRCIQILAASVGQFIAYQDNQSQIQVIKGDRLSIGGHDRLVNKSITHYELDAEKIKTFYLSSDGYQDQFGGSKNSRFSKKKLLELYEQIAHKTPSKKKELLDTTIENWRKEANEDQIDDILIMGVELEAYSLFKPSMPELQGYDLA